MRPATAPDRGRIVVFGILFWFPLAGVTYQFLHYLIGLRRLGYDPYYVEDSGRWVYDPALNDLTPDADANIAAVLPALERFGFADRWAFRGCYPGGKCHGMSEPQLAALYRDADAFLNITGAQEIREEHRAIKRRVYIESDPFALQVKAAQGDPSTAAALAAHDTLFTFGENIGAPDCPVPVAGHRWLPTRQPVVLDLWNPAPPPGGRYSTISTWRNTGKDVEWRGETWHWTKDREFRKFLDLPHRCRGHFELAATVDAQTRDTLLGHGWTQRDSVALSRDTRTYREYIHQSRGEFTVARDQYVRGNTGWFSDRSACYLASGRPVITQDTGFGKHLPTGSGLFGFRTLDEAAAAVEAIESDYPRHCEAARDVAREYFSAEKVIGRLMDEAGL